MTKLGATLALVALPIACSVELGELPARCSEGECPEGYECIHEICALPGTEVPLLVATLGNLRSGDLQLVPQSNGVFVVWETYAYSERGQAVSARFLSSDALLGEEIVLDDTWVADPGAVEPFFSVASEQDGQLVLALSSSPIDEDPRPRIGVFRVQVDGGSVSSEPAWPEEVRMSTIGFGNVSQPRFLPHDEGGFELGYFEGVVDDTLTTGRLAVFDTDAEGTLTSALERCPENDPACCPAHRCYASERVEAIAAGVERVFDLGDTAMWTIDRTRPSCLVTDPTDPTVPPAPSAELFLDPLSLPLSSSADEVLFLVPSKRVGEKLPNGPVEGAAKLARAPLDGEASIVGELPVVRDTPTPAWVQTGAEAGLLITPGALPDGPELVVLELGLNTAQTTEKARISRLSALEVGAVTSALVDGKLFVVWLEVADDRALIRATVLPAP